MDPLATTILAQLADTLDNEADEPYPYRPAIARAAYREIAARIRDTLAANPLPAPIVTFGDGVDLPHVLSFLAAANYIVGLTVNGVDLEARVIDVGPEGITGRVRDPRGDGHYALARETWAWEDIDRIHIH